jgi:noranthrone synthase
METIVSRRQKSGATPAKTTPAPAKAAPVPVKMSPAPAPVIKKAETLPVKILRKPEPKFVVANTVPVAMPVILQPKSQPLTTSAKPSPVASEKFNGALDIIAEESGIAIEELTDDTIFSDIGVGSLLSMAIVSRFREELSLALDPEFNLFLDCGTVKLMRGFLATFSGDDAEEPQAQVTEEPFTQDIIVETETFAMVEPSPPIIVDAEPFTAVEYAPSVTKSEYAIMEDEFSAHSISTTKDNQSLVRPSTEGSFLGVTETAAVNKALVSAGLAIVSEESGIAESDLTDDTQLADIGVDSLLLTVISSRLRKELGLELDPEFSLFVSCPSIGELKAFLAGQSGRDDGMSSDDAVSEEADTGITTSASEGEACRAATSVLLQDVPANAARTLFLLQDGSGSASSYTQLPRVRDDVAITGVNCPYVRDPENMMCGAGALIDLFVDEITRRQPQGPYHLGGWSCGGAFAFACRPPDHPRRTHPAAH